MSPTQSGKREISAGVFYLLIMGILCTGSAAAFWDGDNPYSSETQEAEGLYALGQPNIFYHNVGLLEVLVTNVGVIGNPNLIDSYGAGWHGGEYLYAAALWVGAIASDNLAYVSTGAYQYEFRPSLDPIDTIYTTFEGSTGGDRPGFASNAGDDDGDGQIDEDPLNGRDDDGDGLIDEDFAAISQQMFTCEYWDYTPEAIARYADHRPLGLRVRQTSFAWSNEGANEFVGLSYTITNDGHETLRQLYLGYFVDSDAGLKEAPSYFNDDGGRLAHVDTTFVDTDVSYSCEESDGTTHDCSNKLLVMDIACMYDTPGSQTGGNAADDLGPGSNGYFGGMFLGHTTDPFGVRAPSQVEIHGCRFFSGSGTYPLGDPANDYERYDLLQSDFTPTRPTTQASDYRYCFSAGPFTELMPGETLEFQVAFVIGDGWDGLKENALKAQRIYNGKWRDTDGIKETGCDGRETCLHIEPGGDPVRWKDPCDSMAMQEGPFKNTECSGPSFSTTTLLETIWKDDDCNCCTPERTGPDPYDDCEGWETLIHWVWTVAPPSPSVNTESDDPLVRAYLEGDRAVRLSWNNASELVADPDDGEIKFCGYRVWRVEGWTRPIGSTGPYPIDWQLIADLAEEPEGSQLDLYAAEHYNHLLAPTDTIPHPGQPGQSLHVYPVGRYMYTDDLGIKNGMLYFYDVTSYSCWIDPDTGEEIELSNQPAASESEGARPRWAAASSNWQDQVMVVPNPWNGGAAWDLTPSDIDPTGTHIDFAKLPDKDCDVRIYTLAGDLVETIHQNHGIGSGTLRWDMISRNGQDITSGVYLYAVTCGDETVVKRFTVIR